MGKTVIKLDDIELRHVIKAVREYRNDLLKRNNNSPAVDQLMIKIMNAKAKER